MTRAAERNSMINLAHCDAADAWSGGIERRAPTTLG
jgi:hypothetical protein